MKCRECNCELVINVNASETDVKYSIYLCASCKSQKSKKYREETQYNIIKNLDNKKIFLDSLGNECNCCGETGWQFLTLDHVNNDGAIDRKNGKIIGANSFYRFLNSEDVSRFQALCMNCNYSKGHNGFCPHIIINNTGNACSFCQINLNDNNWLNVNKHINHFICNDCLLDNSVSKNPIQDRKKKLRKKKDILNLKFSLVNEYGGACECCGETELLFLNIDHVSGGGRLENKEIKKYGADFYRWLKKNNYPKDNYRLLCYNCNCCREAYGICYHELCKNMNSDFISVNEYKDIILHNNKETNVA